MPHDLCDLPDVNIEDDGGEMRRGLAYLRSVIREARQASPGEATFQFTFDIVRFNHAHGMMYVVEAGLCSTIAWELTSTPDEPGRKGRPPRFSVPRPLSGQPVARVGSGMTDLSEADLLFLVTTLVANRVMTG